MQCGLQRTKTEASGSCVPRIKRRVLSECWCARALCMFRFRGAARARESRDAKSYDVL